MAQSTNQFKLKSLFTQSDQDAYSLLDWTTLEAKIVNPQTDQVVFAQDKVEFPRSWSQNAVNIVSQKYFVGELGKPERESSLKQLIDRVVDTIADHGQKAKYFKSKSEVAVFTQELKYILASQRASFNSPVWFNIGASSREQQASACFILSIEDDMRSILNWYYEEGMIFKGGSGAGINISPLRSSFEHLSYSDGKASGPVSFMRGADSSAGTIRSGGKTRRAAKMVILNVDHPDIEAFIWCKAREERKSHILAQAGFDMSLDGEDFVSIQYQNANNSVRVSDKFMQAVAADDDWQLEGVNTNKVYKTIKAKQLMRQIAQAAWECADPGMQFDDTINYWHTTPNAGRINASNPCSEYMHIDDSACNLASINLMKFIDGGNFLVDQFKHVVEIMILAQEILVGYSSYPTKKITQNAFKYRQLGLGYANLGALLMSQGLAYDSDSGRVLAATVTALMTGHAYATSAKIAQRVGPFAGFEKDSKATKRVIKQHRRHLKQIDSTLAPDNLMQAAKEAWGEAVELADRHGVRNSQVSVLAPTGTIGLMMDCDTTGIEPDLGLVKLKTLVGGGSMKFVNQTISLGLKALGYGPDQIAVIEDYIETNGVIDNAPGFKVDHKDIFACSIGDNAIHYLGHVRMMSAVQPFLSGAISKTVNMPNEATVEEVEQLFLDAWRLKVKAVAIYRDGCKVAQPLKVARQGDLDQDKAAYQPVGFTSKRAVRRRLPRQRDSKTFKFIIAGSKGFVTIGQFEDDKPGEIFIKMSKQGSTLAGIMDSLAISVSYGLQYGIPLKSYVKAFINTSFAPSGLTDDPDIKTATSIIDYVFRRLAFIYLDDDDLVEMGIIDLNQIKQQALSRQTKLIKDDLPPTTETTSDWADSTAPICTICGNQTQRAGGCFVCQVCGQTTGCS